VKFYNGIEGLDIKKPIITIGMFDGVHLGHTTVLKKVIERAKQIGGESVLLSFWPHPRIVFEGEKTTLRVLNSIEEKKNNLEQIGIDHFILYPFSREFAKTLPEDYVEDLLVKKLKAHTVIIGYDHRFGHKGAGNFALMKELGEKFSFNVEHIPAFEIEQMNVSSTRVRDALNRGDIEHANKYLSYNYSIRGRVVSGNQIGRKLGYPTANIKPDNELKLIPKNGVYIVRLQVSGKWHNAVASIGVRPTIEHIEEVHAVEVFIMNFNKNIYGQEVVLSFLKRIRDEEKFKSIDELKEYIAKDIEIAEAYFKINLK